MKNNLFLSFRSTLQYTSADTPFLPVRNNLTSRTCNGRGSSPPRFEKDLTRKGTRDRRQFENVGFLVSLIRHQRGGGRRFLYQPGGLRLRANGRRGDQNRRLTLPALNRLAVQRFIADDDFMTVRAFKFDGVHSASVVWLNS